MRKYDIFGKKISQIKFVYLLIIVLLLGIVGYFGVIRLQVNRLDELEKQEKAIQQQIDRLLAINEPVTYQTIDELIPYLPQSYDQYIINQELNYILNSSGFEEIEKYSVVYNEDVLSPFDQVLPTSVKFVRISINLTVMEPEKLLNYLDYLYDLNRLYLIEQFSVSYTIDGAIAQIVLYTFYTSTNS